MKKTELFDILVEKLRTSEITFEWTEITRNKFKIDNQMVEYILEIAELTVGYEDAYVIARVTPCYDTVNRVDDERTSYHLYRVHMNYEWDEIAINQAINSLPTTRVDDLINKISDGNEVMEIIEQLFDDDKVGVPIEDYLKDLV